MKHASHYKVTSTENIEKIGSKFWEENNQLFFDKVQSESKYGYTRFSTLSEYLFPGIRMRDIGDPRAVYFKRKAEELGFFVKLDFPLKSDEGISVFVSWE